MASNVSPARVGYAQVQYYLREKLWRHAQVLASELFMAHNDHCFALWRAFALDREGAHADALREFKACEGKRGVTTAALVGQHVIYTRNKDKEAQTQVEARLKAEEARMNVGAVVQAAALLYHYGEFTRARDMLTKPLESEPDYRDELTNIVTVRAWIDLASGRGGAFVDKCTQLFEQVLRSEMVDGMVDIDAVIGKCACYEKKNQYWPACELLNKCIVAHRSFTIAHIIKARMLIRMDEWDQVAEIISSVLNHDASNVEGLILNTLNLLVRESRVQAASRTIADLVKALQHREPRNAALYLSCAQCFSRLAGSSLPVLTLTASLAESAAQLSPQSTEAACEVAYQSVLRGDFRTAHALYKKVSTAGDGSMLPLLGMINCAVNQGSLQEAAKQIEFLEEIQSGPQRNAELLYLGALVSWRKNRDQQASVDRLDKAVEAHKADYAAASGIEMYIKLNPALMILIAKEYMQHCSPTPGEGSRPDPVADRARKLLDLLLRSFPGCTEAQLLNSKMAFVSGDLERAASLVAACIRQDSGLAEAHLLQARILQHAGNFNGASAALEQALSLDFEVNNMPSFGLLRGTLLYQKGEYDAALQALKAAVTLMGGPTPSTPAAAASPVAATPVSAMPSAAAAPPPPPPPPPTAAAPKNAGALSSAEYATLYLTLAQCYVKMRDLAMATQTLLDAAAQLAGTPHQARVHIAQAMLVSRSDAEQAFGILRAIPQSSPHFLAAKAHMAQMYLTLRGNRRAFARCYEEVVEAMPSLQSYIHLGDAYAGIQEPEKAIIAYEKARAKDPNNAELSVKIGRTLVTTHDYQRALRYYRDAVVADPSRTSLRTDLAELYWRLGDVEKAIQTLKDAPVMRRPPAQDDMAAGLERVNLTLLQARIFRGAGKLTSAVDCLIQARVYQNAVVQKARSESPDVLAAQKAVAASICMEVGHHHNNQHDFDKAIHFYSEALKHDEGSSDAMLSLARIHLQRGDSDNCEAQCNALLRVMPTCEEAIVMLADLMFRRGRYDDAAYHFLQLLEKHPENYTAMVAYVGLLRRSGHLTEAPRVFEAAEKLQKAGTRVPSGLAFARGLYHRYIGASREALTHFNLARVPRANPFAQKALIHMIELYINPDATNLWEDVEMRPEVEDNLKTADKLIQDVEDNEKRLLLSAYCLMASKRREAVEKAISIFQELNEVRLAASESDGASEAGGAPPVASASGADFSGADKATEKIYAPALVGQAIGYQILKNNSKARTFLKRLTKPNYNTDEEDDFERGYLLLASIYIENGKFDLAQGQLNKAIAANKSCCRAWELMGLIYEKEQSYRDASDCYESAWRLMGEKDPSVGFKLAFNYLKAKRHVQAIDVCHKVLDAHPAYPKIRKDVLERARMALRGIS